MNKLSNILTVLVIAAGCGLWLYTCNLQKKVADGKNAQELLQNRDQQIEYYRNRDSQLVAKVITNEATKKNIEILLADNKTLKEQVGKLSRIQYYGRTDFEMQDSFITEVYKYTYFVDSLIYDTATRFQYNDGFLSLSCLQEDDSVKCTYSYKDQVTTVTYLKPAGKWWQFWKWGQKTSYTEVNFSNPKTKPTKVESILKKER